MGVGAGGMGVGAPGTTISAQNDCPKCAPFGAASSQTLLYVPGVVGATKFIAICAVCPGWVKTVMDDVEQARGTYSDSDITDRVPMARFASTDDIACWFIDSDYNEESFFVRHAYFLGANDPYKSLKTTLKAEINEDAWATLNSDTSRPFAKPKGGRIAVKVINHLGDEVMKVFKV